MFSNAFRHNTTKTGKVASRAISELPTTGKRTGKILLVRVLLSLLFRQIVKKLFILFGPHCNISAYTQDYELKFTIQTKFDTLISNLNSYVQYKVIMTS